MVNVERSAAPDWEFKYNDQDIIQKIRDDFFVLCYLCEEYVPVHFEIDHFFPQKYFSKKENDWDNLFYCCEKCNKIRPKDTNTDGNEVLNNCTDDVENSVGLCYNNEKYRIDIKGNSNPKAANTIRLLHKIYNGIGTNSKSYIYRREEIKSELEKFNELLDKYKNSKIKNAFEKLIKERLSKKTKSEKSAYVSFKRTLIKENPELSKFSDYFD